TISVAITTAAIQRLVRGGRRQHRVIAGHMGKAPKIRAVGEAVAAGGEALVAARREREAIARRHRLAHRLPQFDADDTAADGMPLHLHAASWIGAAGEDQLAAGEGAPRETAEPIDREAPRIEDG